MLCLMLGRLFEPYVVHILPHLLLCFGDNNQYVREVRFLPGGRSVCRYYPMCVTIFAV
jgi:hypothetical protein